MCSALQARVLSVAFVERGAVHNRLNVPSAQWTEHIEALLIDHVEDPDGLGLATGIQVISSHFLQPYWPIQRVPFVFMGTDVSQYIKLWDARSQPVYELGTGNNGAKGMAWDAASAIYPAGIFGRLKTSSPWF